MCLVNFFFTSGVTVGFENATYMIGESEMIITICIVLIGELEHNVTVNLQTNEGSATGKYCGAFTFYDIQLDNICFIDELPCLW